MLFKEFADFPFLACEPIHKKSLAARLISILLVLFAYLFFVEEIINSEKQKYQTLPLLLQE